jgi:hypothetical protein
VRASSAKTSPTTIGGGWFPKPVIDFQARTNRHPERTRSATTPFGWSAT